MARTNYTDSQKVAFIKAWLASNKPKSRWHKEQAEAGNIEGHYNAFSQWIEKYEKGEFGEQPEVAPALTGTQQVAKPSRSNPNTSSNVLGNVGRNSSLLAEFQQSLLPEDVQARYIDFLEGKVSGLTSELETLQAENANLHALIEKLEAPEGQQ